MLYERYVGFQLMDSVNGLDGFDLGTARVE